MEATEFFYRVLNSWKFFPWYLGNFHSLLHNLVRRVFLFVNQQWGRIFSEYVLISEALKGKLGVRWKKSTVLERETLKVRLNDKPFTEPVYLA